MESKKLAKLTFDAMDDKKGESIVCLSMLEKSTIADYFLICHGNNEKHVQAIAREIREQAHQAGKDVKRMEGFDDARWILVDMGDVIAHVFSKDDRIYYNLEKLWGNAPQIQSEFVEENL